MPRLKSKPHKEVTVPAKSSPRKSGFFRSFWREPLTLEYHDVPGSADARHPLHKFIHHAKIVVALVLIAVVCANLFALAHFTPYAKNERRTLQLAGINITNEDKSSAAKHLAEAAKNQKIQIFINDKSYTYSAKGLGLERDFSSLLDAGYASPDSLINKITTKESQPSLKTYVQRGRLISEIESSLGEYKTAVNASVSVKDGQLVVNPSRTGMTLDFNQISEQLKQTDMRSSIGLTASLTTRQPVILTEAAQAAKEHAQDLIAPAYGASTASNSSFATPAQKVGWLIFTPNNTKQSIDVSIDPKAARTTLNKLAQGFARPVKARITLASSAGDTTVIDEGQSGIILDQTSLNDGLDSFQSALDAHHSYTLPLKVTEQPQGERNLGTANGGKFVLVDLADFKAWAINNTTVDRAMLISSGRPGLETPKGHFNILRKIRLITMTGCNKMVGCWTVPNVPNAEFFTPEGHALHGTYWHNRFGQANLSHGCVNLSLSDAAWLYDWTVVGTDVVIV